MGAVQEGRLCYRKTWAAGPILEQSGKPEGMVSNSHCEDFFVITELALAW